jgi:hypothetical protein
MQRCRGAVVTDIGREFALCGKGINAFEIRALMNEPTFIQDRKEIGTVSGHGVSQLL